MNKKEIKRDYDKIILLSVWKNLYKSNQSKVNVFDYICGRSRRGRRGSRRRKKKAG